jgi:hypothetical protein
MQRQACHIAQSGDRQAVTEEYEAAIQDMRISGLNTTLNQDVRLKNFAIVGRDGSRRLQTFPFRSTVAATASETSARYARGGNSLRTFGSGK